MADKTDVFPTAWRDLLSALTLLAKGHSNNISPLHCEHDELTVMANPANFTDEELGLADWGFHSTDDGTFYSFRYGSA